MEFVGLAASAGVRVVAGTDTPNPFVLPGQSLRDELELLLVVRGDPVSSITATRWSPNQAGSSSRKTPLPLLRPVSEFNPCCQNSTD